MAALIGKYVGLTAAELATLRANLIAAQNACLTAHQNYSRPGFSFNRVAFDSICQELAEVNYAQQIASGDIVTRTFVDARA